jgi:hypothetical protein
VDEWLEEGDEETFGWRDLSICRGVNCEPSIDFLSRYVKQPLDWGALSLHSRATDLIRLFPSKPLDLGLIAKSSHVTIKWLRDPIVADLLKDYRPLWDILSQNTAFSESDIENNLDLPWSVRQFACHSGLSLGFYQRNSSLDIDWSGISHLEAFDLLSLLPKPINLDTAWHKAKTFEDRARILLTAVRSIVRSCRR